MARIGAFCFPGTGHINPITALARRLQQRGHTVVISGIADVEASVKAAGIEFCLVGESDYPRGTLKKLDRRLSKQRGVATQCSAMVIEFLAVDSTGKNKEGKPYRIENSIDIQYELMASPTPGHKVVKVKVVPPSASLKFTTDGMNPANNGKP
jgi:hypothetical protein